jgi:predicted Zn-dependent protease
VEAIIGSLRRIIMPRSRLWTFCLILAISGFLFSQTPSIAAPEFKTGNIIVDDEADEILSNWVRQLFKAAKLKGYTPRVYLVVDPELNAAATVGGIIIIHTGLILNCKNAGELLGVLAHEVGHIAGGHVSRFDAAAQGALVPAAVALLLGGAAAVATGNSDPLVAGIMGGSHLFERGLLKFSRTQESSADQAAMTYLDSLGFPSQGFYDFLKVIHDKTIGYPTQMDPYALTHPMTSERLNSVQHHLQHSTKLKSSIPTEFEEQFQLLKAKLSGFLEAPKTVEQKWGKSSQSTASQYALAVAAYRTGQTQKSLALLEDLARSLKNDGYVQELKGQILFENGQIEESINSLEKAVSKKPKAELIKVLLAQALLESQRPDAISKAKQCLIPVTQTHPDNAFAWRLLATAYGKENDLGMTAICLAEEALLLQDYKLAKTHAERAKKILPQGSKGTTKAEDILKNIAQQKPVLLQ